MNGYEFNLAIRKETGQVWGRTPEQCVAASTFRRYFISPSPTQTPSLSCPYPSDRTTTQPWSLWMPLRHGPANKTGMVQTNIMTIIALTCFAFNTNSHLGVGCDDEVVIIRDSDWHSGIWLISWRHHTHVKSWSVMANSPRLRPSPRASVDISIDRHRSVICSPPSYLWETGSRRFGFV